MSGRAGNGPSPRLLELVSGRPSRAQLLALPRSYPRIAASTLSKQESLVIVVVVLLTSMLSAIFTGSPAASAHLRPCSTSLLPTKKYRGYDQVSPVFEEKNVFGLNF